MMKNSIDISKWSTFLEFVSNVTTDLGIIFAEYFISCTFKGTIIPLHLDYYLNLNFEKKVFLSFVY